MMRLTIFLGYGPIFLLYRRMTMPGKSKSPRKAVKVTDLPADKKTKDVKGGTYQKITWNKK